MVDTVLVPVQDLLAFGAKALRATGVPHEDAELVSLTLAEADRRGIGSHGFLRLPLYVEALRAGGINPTPRLSWPRAVGATAVLDADAALGQVAMVAAVERAARLAREHGVAAVAVQNSTHYGAGAFWTDRLVGQGMVGIVTSTTGAAVTPFGGSEKVLGTNPLTIGAPSAGPSALTADLATSAGAYGKVVAARSAGTALPAGWAVDDEGNPTTDPAAALRGALLPFGGAKGSALSVLLEALSAALTTASYAHETEDIWADRASRMNTGHLVIALDTDAFTGRRHTERRVAALQERVRGSAAAGRTVFAPGDVERAAAAESRDAVRLARSTVELLHDLAESLGITSPARAAAG